MPSTIVLNQNNLVRDGNNNQFVYNFPNSLHFPHHEIAVQSINMFYSWNNISVPLANTTFTFYYPTNSAGAVSSGVAQLTTIVINIPPGQYSIAQLNSLVQYYCIQNGLYLIDAGGNNVYYLELLINAPRYAIQVNTFPLPLATNFTYSAITGIWTGNPGTSWAGWTTPVASASAGTTAFAGFPTNGVNRYNPAFLFPANFSDIVGFAAGTYTYGNPTTFPNGQLVGPPTLAQLNLGINCSYLSSQAPQVQPNSSIYVSVSNILNKYASPNSIIYSLNPRVEFGLQISEYPPQFAWNRMLNGTYSQIRLQILGLNFQPLQILDPNMTIVLVIRDTHDEGSVYSALEQSTGGK